MSSVKRTGLTGHSSIGVPGPPTVSVGPFYPDLQARLQQEPTPPQQKPAFFFPKADCPEKDPGTLSKFPSVCSGREILGLGGGGWVPGFLATCLLPPPTPHLLAQSHLYCCR